MPPKSAFSRSAGVPRGDAVVTAASGIFFYPGLLRETFPGNVGGTCASNSSHAGSNFWGPFCKQKRFHLGGPPPLLTPNNTALALGLRAQQRPEASSTYYCESPRPENINQQCTLVQFWGVKNGALNSSKSDFTIKALSSRRRHLLLSQGTSSAATPHRQARDSGHLRAKKKQYLLNSPRK